MTHKHALRYSLDPKITLSTLKGGSFSCDLDTSDLSTRMEKHAVGAVVHGEDRYHYKLLPITQSPYIVYYQGLYELLNKPLLAVVGPRRMTDYAKQVVTKLIAQAARYDLVTVSGMAEGVDRLVHEESMKHNIPTVAILGGGLGYYMQSRHHAFMERIVEAGGLILSDFRLKQKPAPYTFPQRNRIVAGLANTVFVPEASEKSGSLITVDYALAMKKAVYAAPQSMFVDTHKGLHRYIAEKGVTLSYDLEKFLDMSFQSGGSSSKESHGELSADEKVIVQLFEHATSLTLQDMVEKTRKDSADVMHLITLLELSGIIYQSAPGQYALA